MSFFTVRFAGYLCAALAVVIAVLGFAVWGMKAALGVERAQVKAGQVTIESQKRSIEGFQAAIRDQNEAIELLRAEGEKRQAQAAEAVSRARADAAKADGRRQALARLLAVPGKPGEDCQAALSVIRRDLRK